MTNQQHLITPSPELVEEWWNDTKLHLGTSVIVQLCIQAAQWGSDQELKACCEWLALVGYGKSAGRLLRAARRPKPPSLKEEVRQIIDCLIEGDCLNDDDAVTMLRVLEVLPND